jgi:hypothetical protein
MLGLVAHTTTVKNDASWSRRPLTATRNMAGRCTLGGADLGLVGEVAGEAAYRNLLRRYLLPTFGPMPLADLDAMAVRAWLAKLERDG